MGIRVDLIIVVVLINSLASAALADPLKIVTLGESLGQNQCPDLYSGCMEANVDVPALPTVRRGHEIQLPTGAVLRRDSRYSEKVSVILSLSCTYAVIYDICCTFQLGLGLLGYEFSNKEDEYAVFIMRGV